MRIIKRVCIFLTAVTFCQMLTAVFVTSNAHAKLLELGVPLGQWLKLQKSARCTTASRNQVEERSATSKLALCKRRPCCCAIEELGAVFGIQPSPSFEPSTLMVFETASDSRFNAGADSNGHDPSHWLSSCLR
eukprot:4913969-Amphidinium_carterae.1